MRGRLAYRIHICDAPKSADEFRKHAVRAEQIANALARRSAYVTETEPTHVRFEMNSDVDAIWTLLHSLDVSPGDITQEG